MEKANNDIRVAARENGVFLYLIAERLGIQESYLCKKMRHELSASEKKKVMEIIEELSREEKQCAG